MRPAIDLVPGRLTLAALRAIAAGPVRLVLDAGARPAVDAAERAVARLVAEHRTVYGVNTGFGLLARTRIDDTRLAELQRALLLSHAAGTGPLLDDGVVRLVLALKAASLARGHSGVRWSLVEALVALANADVLPCVPSIGSVGASGDLAPLAHLSGVLIGEGEVRIAGRVASAAEGLARAGLAPMTLAPKEGLALINGTQVSTALALAGLFAHERVLAAAFVAGALSVDAAQGSDTPFDARIHALRGHAGPARRRGDLPALARGQRDPRLARDLRPRAGSLQPALPAAGDGRDPRPGARGRGDAARRGERGLRQPARVRGRGRGALRRQLPRRAGRLRRRQPRARDRRDRRARPSGGSRC